MSKETFMIESLTRDVIMMLMDEKGLSMRDAMDKFYSSHTFKVLSDPETGLLFQSPVYVYGEYERELKINGYN